MDENCVDSTHVGTIWIMPEHSVTHSGTLWMDGLDSRAEATSFNGILTNTSWPLGTKYASTLKVADAKRIHAQQSNVVANKRGKPVVQDASVSTVRMLFLTCHRI